MYFSEMEEVFWICLVLLFQIVHKNYFKILFKSLLKLGNYQNVNTSQGNNNKDGS